MENINEINKKIAKNLIYYRKEAGLTQAEVAEKINYSDKSVSKWESGNGLPDVYTLVQLAELFGVTASALLGEETLIKEEKLEKKKPSLALQNLLILLSSGIVWLVGLLIFVTLGIMYPEGEYWWYTFLYAALANSIVALVYATIWRRRVLNFACVSIIIWMGLTCLYLTVERILFLFGESYRALWLIFLLGIPLQLLEIFWSSFRALLRKHRKESQTKKEQTTAEGE